MSTQVADREALPWEVDRLAVAGFNERSWVPWLLFSVDVAAVEMALRLGYLSHSALSSWWPIDLAPATYAGLIAGVLILPVCYFVVGLYPGYGLGEVERLRRRVTTTLLIFDALIAWDNIVLPGAWSRGMLLLTFFFALLRR